MRGVGMVAVLLGVLMQASTSAQVLDQSNQPDPATFVAGVQMTDNYFISVAQTFTVGVTGKLAKLEFPIYRTQGTQDFSVNIVATENGVPRSEAVAILASAVIPSASVPQQSPSAPWLSVDFNNAGLQVYSGELLAFTVDLESPSVNPSQYFLVGSDPIGSDNYAGGQYFFENSDTRGVYIPAVDPNDAEDLSFREYVTPEPGTPLLSGVCCVLLCRRRRLARA